MGIQQTPPNLVLAGISLFLTLYIMGPVIGQINETAYQPYLRGELTQEEAVAQMSVPMKEFMLRNTEKETLDHVLAEETDKKNIDAYVYGNGHAAYHNGFIAL